MNKRTPWIRILIQYKQSIIAGVLQTPRNHYDDPNSPPLEPTLNYTNAAHTLKTYFLKICFNIVLSTTPRFTMRSLPFKSLDYVPLSSHSCLFPGHLILLDLITRHLTPHHGASSGCEWTSWPPNT